MAGMKRFWELWIPQIGEARNGNRAGPRDDRRDVAGEDCANREGLGSGAQTKTFKLDCKLSLSHGLHRARDFAQQCSWQPLIQPRRLLDSQTGKPSQNAPPARPPNPGTRAAPAWRLPAQRFRLPT